MEYTVLSNPQGTELYSPITYGAGIGSPAPDLNLQQYLDNLLAGFVNTLYPVGSHYITTTDDDPAILFNVGVWEKVTNNRTLMGADDSTYILGDSGGYSTVTITTTTMPSHTHGVTSYTHSRAGNNAGTADYGRPSTGSGVYTSANGSGSSHTNLQPYIYVIVWKRVK